MKRAFIIGASLVLLGGQGAQAQSNPIQGTPGSFDPYAAPHEIHFINGVPCRTVFDRQRQMRVPVACFFPSGVVTSGGTEPLVTSSTSPQVVGSTSGTGQRVATRTGRRIVSRSDIPVSGFYSQCTPGRGCTSAGYPFARYRGTPGPRPNFYRNIKIV